MHADRAAPQTDSQPPSCPRALRAFLARLWPERDLEWNLKRLAAPPQERKKAEWAKSRVRQKSRAPREREAAEMPPIGPAAHPQRKKRERAPNRCLRILLPREPRGARDVNLTPRRERQRWAGVGKKRERCSCCRTAALAGTASRRGRNRNSTPRIRSYRPIGRGTIRTRLKIGEAREQSRNCRNGWRRHRRIWIPCESGVRRQRNARGGSSRKLQLAGQRVEEFVGDARNLRWRQPPRSSTIARVQSVHCGRWI